MFLSEKDLKKMKKSDVIAYAVKNLSSEPVTPSIAVEVPPPKKQREPSDWVKFVKAHRKPGVGFADLSKMYKETKSVSRSAGSLLQPSVSKSVKVEPKKEKVVKIKEKVVVAPNPKSVESMSMPMKAITSVSGRETQPLRVSGRETPPKPKKGDKKKD